MIATSKGGPYDPCRRTENIVSYIIWFVLGSIALFVAIKVVGRRAHILLPAAVLTIAGLAWASPSSAVRGQPDRPTALTLARTTDSVRSVVGDLDGEAAVVRSVGW